MLRYWHVLRFMLGKGHLPKAALLGPVWIKWFQLLATYGVSSLAWSYDAVPLNKQRITPFPETLRPTLTPLALIGSASMAVVYKARDQQGQYYAVKCIKQHAKRSVKQDLFMIRLLIYGLHWLPMYRSVQLPNVLRVLSDMFFNELDCTIEHRHQRMFKEANKHCMVPTWHDAVPAYGVMSWLNWDGEPASVVKVGDMAKWRSQGLHPHHAIRLLSECFLNGVFENHCFHADMHPGNVFFVQSHTTWKVALVDFGIIGHLTASDRYFLAANMLAFSKNDYQKVAWLHWTSGWIPNDTFLPDFERALTHLQWTHTMPLSHLLQQFLAIGKRFKIAWQPNLLLLQRALFQLERTLHNIDPQHDMLQSFHPFLKRWLRRPSLRRKHPLFWLQPLLAWPMKQQRYQRQHHHWRVLWTIMGIMGLIMVYTA
jgi:ubiquinone biosynthesis protein